LFTFCSFWDFLRKSPHLRREILVAELDFCTAVAVGFAPREVSSIQRFLSCFFSFLFVICFEFLVLAVTVFGPCFESMMNVKPKVFRLL
jgi:hypothetical protein